MVQMNHYMLVEKGWAKISVKNQDCLNFDYKSLKHHLDNYMWTVYRSLMHRCIQIIENVGFIYIFFFFGGGGWWNVYLLSMHCAWWTTKCLVLAVGIKCCTCTPSRVVLTTESWWLWVPCSLAILSPSLCLLWELSFRETQNLVLTMLAHSHSRCSSRNSASNEN